MLNPGDTVDRYVVVEHLGGGGMAEVYKVRHTILGSQHALKVLHPRLVENPEFRDRFIAEGRIQAQIRHPNIASVTDVVSTGGVAGLVMEMVEGPTLDEHILAQSGPLEIADILAIMRPVLAGVAAAHNRGIVHRDLKPENIVIARDPTGRLRPVILDFGIAKVAEDAGLDHRARHKTRADHRMGTLHYMSPEQVRSSTSVDQRTDIFALGAILYELATGRVAFVGDSEFDTMKRIVDGNYEAPERMPGGTSPALAAVINTALSTDRNDRFADCATFQSALDTVAGEAATPPVPERSITEVLRPEPDETEPTIRARPARRAAGCWLSTAVLAGGALLAIAVLGVVAVPIWKGHQRDKSVERAAQAMAQMEHHKRDASANKDDSVLQRALDLAEEGAAAADTPEALGARALALVWVQRWHYANAGFDSSRFSYADRVTREAMAHVPRPEALLARALLTSSACTWLPDSDGRRSGLCDEAREGFEAAETAFRDDQRTWLRFEMWWTWAVFHNRMALGAWKGGDKATARGLWREGLTVCGKGKPDLPEAPVNDRELAEECIAASGFLEEYEDYFWWARWLRSDDEAGQEGLTGRSLLHIYKGAHVQCDTLTLTMHPRWKKKVPHLPRDDWAQHFCYTAGLLALGCSEDAVEVIALSVPRSPEEFPWQKMRDARGETNRPCYLRED
ncbi:MAG: serine/threonine protein kinase [Deltaproteobacteria bacterium]|nr:serine/threonine protein kinase [Deltaproteobacteria bacterium]